MFIIHFVLFYPILNVPNNGTYYFFLINNGTYYHSLYSIPFLSINASIEY